MTIFRNACIILAFLGLNIPQNCKAQAATFDIEYIGFSAESEAAFDYAAAIWSQYLISAVPIKIVAHMQPLLPGQLGITFPNGNLNFADAPVSDVWYASSLANAISGIDLQSDNADIEIYFNSTANWYFGIDEVPVPGKYDFVSTVLHEICHGLGFLSLANKVLTEGSIGTITAASFSPLTTSFPWPELNSLPAIFDIFIENMAGDSMLAFNNPSDALGTELISNAMFYNSPKVMEQSGGIRPKLYAPASFTLGSSITHWDEATYPVGSDNEFMTPQAAPGHADHQPGILTLKVLEDIGWQINYDITAVQFNIISKQDVKIFPSPASDILHIYLLNISNTEIQIFSISGEKIWQDKMNDTQYQLDISKWQKGIYFIKIKSGDTTINKEFIIV